LEPARNILRPYLYDEPARSGKNDINQHETALLRIGTSAGDAAMKS
jgi:hypothetical protein